MTTKNILFFPMGVGKYFRTDYESVMNAIIDFTPLDTKYSIINRYTDSRLFKMLSKIKTHVKHSTEYMIDVYDTEQSQTISSVKNYKDFKDLVYKALDKLNPNEIVVFCGHTHNNYSKEYKNYLRYLDFKEEPVNTRIFHTLFDMYFSFCLIEWSIEKNIEVKNIWLDPLQMKFQYMQGAKIRNEYFHKHLNIEEQIYYHKDSGKYTNSKVNTHEFNLNFAHLYNDSAKLKYNIENKLSEDTLKNIIFNKNQKLVFGSSAAWPDDYFRMALIRQLMLVDDKEHVSKGYYITFTTRLEDSPLPKTSKNKLLDYHSYVNKISNSFTTFVIPSICTESFSTIRFVETVANMCIPILTDNCKYERGFNFEPTIIEFYEKNDLFIDTSQINFNYNDNFWRNAFIKIEQVIKDYPRLIKELYQTEYIQELSKSETYKQQIQSMLNLNTVSNEMA